MSARPPAKLIITNRRALMLFQALPRCCGARQCRSFLLTERDAASADEPTSGIVAADAWLIN